MYEKRTSTSARFLKILKKLDEILEECNQMRVDFQDMDEDESELYHINREYLMKRIQIIKHSFPEEISNKIDPGYSSFPDE